MKIDKSGGYRSARTRHANTANAMNWIAVAAGAWLMIGSFMLRYPVLGAGLWNEIIVGVSVSILGVWAARAAKPGPH